jgi:hypothetical protein
MINSDTYDLRIRVVLFFKATIHLGSINKEIKGMMTRNSSSSSSSSSPLLVSRVAVSSLAVLLSSLLDSGILDHPPVRISRAVVVLLEVMSVTFDADV